MYAERNFLFFLRALPHQKKPCLDCKAARLQEVYLRINELLQLLRKQSRMCDWEGIPKIAELYNVAFCNVIVGRKKTEGADDGAQQRSTI